MTDFDLDLRTAEDQLPEDEADGDVVSGNVELGVLDGTTPDEEWLAAVEDGRTLVLNIEGDVNELAAGFARDVRDMGGELVHFRGFLIVAPPGTEVDTDRL
jgi:hypothetical protein